MKKFLLVLLMASFLMSNDVKEIGRYQLETLTFTSKKGTVYIVETVLDTKTGKVVGQLQTYRFALWDLQWQMLKDAKRAGKAGKFGLFETNAKGDITRIMPEIQAAMRYLSLYALIVPIASVVTDLDFGNLVQNETYDTAKRFYEYYTADLDMDRGSLMGVDFQLENLKNNADNAIKSNTRNWKEFQSLKQAGKKWPYRSPHPIDPKKYDASVKEELKKSIRDYRRGPTARSDEELSKLEDKYGQFFGKGALAGNLGPFISDILTIADLFDVYDSTPEELQETMKMKYDPDDPDWWYKMARVANVQGARTGWHTLPAFLKGQWERMGRVETGMYKPKHLYDWMRESDDPIYKQRKDWLYNNPYSPINWMYTGDRMFGVGPALPRVEKKRKRRKNQEAVNVLEGMLAGKW